MLMVGSGLALQAEQRLQSGRVQEDDNLWETKRDAFLLDARAGHVCAPFQ